MENESVYTNDYERWQEKLMQRRLPKKGRQRKENTRRQSKHMIIVYVGRQRRRRRQWKNGPNHVHFFSHWLIYRISNSIHLFFSCNGKTISKIREEATGAMKRVHIDECGVVQMLMYVHTDRAREMEKERGGDRKEKKREWITESNVHTFRLTEITPESCLV